MKALSGNERMEVYSFASYLSREYKKCSNVSRRKGRK